MVRVVGLEPTMFSHLGLNQAPMPIRVHPHIALLFTGVHRCANQPGMVYIYEKLIHIKPRYASSRRNCDQIAPKVSALRHLAGEVGVEPTTHGLTVRCANHYATLPYYLVLTFRFIELLRD